MGEAIGNERDLFVRWLGGTGKAALNVSPYGGEMLQYETDAGVVGSAIVTWDGRDGSASPTPSMGLHGMDLTDGGLNDSLLLKLGVDHPGGGEKVIFRIFANNSATFFRSGDGCASHGRKCQRLRDPAVFGI